MRAAGDNDSGAPDVTADTPFSRSLRVASEAARAPLQPAHHTSKTGAVFLEAIVRILRVRAPVPAIMATNDRGEGTLFIPFQVARRHARDETTAGCIDLVVVDVSIPVDKPAPGYAAARYMSAAQRYGEPVIRKQQPAKERRESHHHGRSSSSGTNAKYVRVGSSRQRTGVGLRACRVSGPSGLRPASRPRMIAASLTKTELRVNASTLIAAIATQWDEDIVPQLIDYVRIPAKSPHFDPRWAANGHI